MSYEGLDLVVVFFRLLLECSSLFSLHKPKWRPENCLQSRKGQFCRWEERKCNQRLLTLNQQTEISLRKRKPLEQLSIGLEHVVHKRQVQWMKEKVFQVFQEKKKTKLLSEKSKIKSPECGCKYIPQSAEDITRLNTEAAVQGVSPSSAAATYRPAFTDRWD